LYIREPTALGLGGLHVRSQRSSAQALALRRLPLRFRDTMLFRGRVALAQPQVAQVEALTLVTVNKWQHLATDDEGIAPEIDRRRVLAHDVEAQQ
jgi:hypothetical protein